MLGLTRPRGIALPIGAFGKIGPTGNPSWIDPLQTHRLHPE